MAPRNPMTRTELADAIEAFLAGTGNPWLWDDLACIPLETMDLERIRDRCLALDAEFPPTEPGHFCSAGGVAVLGEYVRQLRDPAG